jgi:hypothetical protein
VVVIEGFARNKQLSYSGLGSFNNQLKLHHPVNAMNTALPFLVISYILPMCWLLVLLNDGLVYREAGSPPPLT